MARMLWLRFAAGTSLALSMGCQGPSGPSRNSLVTPPPNFPSGPMSGAQPAKTPVTKTPVTTPGISDAKLSIGPASAQATPPTNPTVAKLRPYNPGMEGVPPAIESLPPRSDNALRNLADGEFADWKLGTAPSMPIGGNRIDGNAATSVNNENAPMQIAPPPPMNALPSNTIPMSSPPPYPTTGVSMPPVNSNSLPMPSFPAQSQFPSQSIQPPPNPANNFPIPNTPSAPNLSPQGAVRSTSYPSGNIQ